MAGPWAAAARRSDQVPTEPDLPMRTRLDALGIFYIVFAFVWTVVIVVASFIVYAHRHVPFLRLRALTLTVASVGVLQIWLIMVLLSYPIGLMIPEPVDFWLMSLVFPAGIALFQAANGMFLHVARSQRQFLPRAEAIDPPPSDKARRCRCCNYMPYQKRMTILISVGLGFQAGIELFIFFVSRKFHPGFGIPGTGVSGKGQTSREEQGKGWEWFPSIVWQFFWSWIFAPILLWNARHIKDTHGWRLETFVVCLCGLHATPMWLIAIYVPGMEVVSNYFEPPMWIAVYVIILQTYTVVIPAFLAVRRGHRDQAAQLAACKEKAVASKHLSDPARSSLDTWNAIIYPATTHNPGTAHDGLLTMGALEYVLQMNPKPLQEFSATRDFSGENVAFLISVAGWKETAASALGCAIEEVGQSVNPAAWRQSYAAARQQPQEFLSSGVMQRLTRQQFTGALRIYMDFVSPRDAQFPINISSRDLKMLESIFEDAARRIRGSRSLDTSLPFFGRPGWSSMTDLWQQGWASEVLEGVDDDRDNVLRRLSGRRDSRIEGVLGDIPKEFNTDVFKGSVLSIKHLILTNTWPKFVRESCSTSGPAWR